MDAVGRLIEELPADLPAAVCVVLHLSPRAPSHLPEILRRRSALPISPVRSRQPLLPGHVYVASPDQHLVITDGGIRPSFTARENRQRPAIDALFRTAAAAFRERVVAVLLSGLLDDGAAGLQEVKRAGGRIIVQSDPQYPMMPMSGVMAARPDYITAADKIGGLVARLVREERPSHATPPTPRVDVSDLPGPPPGAQPSDLSCPACGGVLWDVPNGVPPLRCRVGHAYSIEALEAAQGDHVERAVWSAVRALRERAIMLRRLQERMRQRGVTDLGARYGREAVAADEQASLIEAALLPADISADDLEIEEILASAEGSGSQEPHASRS
jgi:two-component system, chemotaxis family, protein-glutamate methylesterase/glutaminase